MYIRLINHVMKRVVFCLLFIVSVKIFNAQTKLAYLSYVFPKDSLAGFHEMGANNAALRGGYFGIEYKVFMYRAKRNFINKKYGYSQSINEFNKNSMPLIAAAPCSNIDFEASPSGSVIAVSGWTISEGSNTSSCTMLGCCANVATGANTWIKTTPFISPGPISMTIPNSPLGGSQIIQLNNEVINLGEIVRLEQTFTVTASNSILQYAYICILNGSGHACCDNPYFNVLVYDCSNTLISAASTSIIAPGSSCVGTVPGMTTTSSGISYFNSWQVKTVNLSAYIGSCVKIQVTTSDCTGWAHEGYGYFDASCNSSFIDVNGTIYSPNGNVNACGNTVTITSSSTLTPTIWDGPPASGITSYTNSVITTTTAGIYTLTIGTGTNSAVNIFTLTIIPPPSLTLVATATACAGGPNSYLTGLPSGGIYSGANVVGSTFVTPSAAGMYTVAYSYMNPVTTCTSMITKTITVNVCTGIESVTSKNEAIKIYPNPNTGEFIVQAKEDDILVITNDLGQVLKTIKLNSENNYSVTISGLANGIYFASGKNFSQKIVVMK